MIVSQEQLIGGIYKIIFQVWLETYSALQTMDDICIAI